MNEGRLLKGRYRLVRLVGEGGMGQVWEGRDEDLHDRRVAVKVLPLARLARSGKNAELDERIRLFEVEVRSMAQIDNNSHVAVIHDRGREPDGLYFVMEFIDGASLAQLLAERDRLELTLEQFVRWTQDICVGLGAIHAQGIIHRDIKPANIMITAAKARAKVADFGLARFLNATESRSAHNTVLYAAPERLRGEPGTPRTDLYSLGCVLYEMLTGRTPFGNPYSDYAYVAGLHLHEPPTPPSAYRAGIPERLDNLVLRLLAKDPEDRPEDADEVYRITRTVLRRPSGGEDRMPALRVSLLGEAQPHVRTDYVAKIRENELFIRERTRQKGELDDEVLDARAYQAKLTGQSGDARGAAALYRSLGHFCATRLGRQHRRVRDAYVEMKRWTDRADDLDDRTNP
ncbi:serine/threonine-protein kinase [Streptomyces sp. NPDC001536]|uniref:serine/threonine-protein kinase n=1 Tax=Streptomyces sp. NPDC001536 TaxID=3364583 RepID=UPI0036CD8EC8